ncbi:MAG: hypothetical protein VX641_02170 [Planctomycetota bacterium]|nr:hypothetical protein [Planctomycetota bacterium]
MLSAKCCRDGALRHLRIVAVLYIAVLIIGTHWPRLDLSGPMGGSDKLFHLLGFGLLIIMVRLAGWSRRFWTLFLWGLLATVLVEYSQSWLPIGRYWSLEDIVAGMIGVVIAALISTSLGPVGGAHARELRARWFAVSFSLLSRVNPCMSILVTGTLGLMVGGILSILLGGLLMSGLDEAGHGIPLRSLDLFVLGGLGVGITATVVCFLAGHGAESTRVGDTEPGIVLGRAARAHLLGCLALPTGILLCLAIFGSFLDPVSLLPMVPAVDVSQPRGFDEPLLQAAEFYRESTRGSLPLLLLGLTMAWFLKRFMRQLARVADDAARPAV